MPKLITGTRKETIATSLNQRLPGNEMITTCQ